MPAWLAGLFLAAAAAEPGPLSYRSAPFRAEVSESGRFDDHVDYDVRFPSPVKSPFKVNDTVWGHLSLPKRPGRLPCVLVLPVMAAPNVWIETRFTRRLVRDGFAVMWLEMPYQFHRRTSRLVPSGQVFLARTAKRLAFNFRQSVLDARRALEWLSGRPEIDPSRLGLFGVSLGGMVGASVYSVDSRPRYAVFLLAGADFPELVEKSSMTGAFVRKAGLDPRSLREAWRGLDPLDYKENDSGKKVLLVNVRWDKVVPKENALKLKEAFPQSRQVWLPFGHYSAIAHLFWMPGFVSRDFQANL